MPSPLTAVLTTAHAVAGGTDGPTSAAVGLPIIGVLVALVVIGGLVYAVVRKR